MRNALTKIRNLDIVTYRENAMGGGGGVGYCSTS